jgi:hypothetical protein
MLTSTCRELFQPKELTSVTISADSKCILVNQAPNVRWLDPS